MSRLQGSTGPAVSSRSLARRPQRIALALATLVLAAVSVLAGKAPAFADGGGNEFCFIGNDATLGATVLVGDVVRIDWQVFTPNCPQHSTHITGHNFGGPAEPLPDRGIRDFHATWPELTATWTIYVVDLVNGVWYELGQVTIFTPPACPIGTCLP